MQLSIIIPTLNEARYLEATLEAVRSRAAGEPAREIVVVDCGSRDGTPELAARLGLCVVRDPTLTCRAAALNCGAVRVTGDVLLFLDADSIVPPGYDRALEWALRSPAVVGGAFEFALDGPEFGLRVVEFVNRLRYRLWAEYFGDQGLFVRREVFRRVGGFPRRRILETSDLCRRLTHVGALRLLSLPLRTSPRRFLEGGIYRVLAHDARIWLLDRLRLPTDGFGPAYWAENRRRGGADRD